MRGILWGEGAEFAVPRFTRVGETRLRPSAAGCLDQRSAASSPGGGPLARAVRASGVYALRGAARRCAGPHRENCPEVGVPVPASREGEPRSTERTTTHGSEPPVRCPPDRGESVKGGLAPLSQKGNLESELAEARASARGSFDSGAKRRAVRERGPNSFPLDNRNRSSGVPPLLDRSTPGAQRRAVRGWGPTGPISASWTCRGKCPRSWTARPEVAFRAH